jgi:AcrR family transcriptional regulator
MLDTGLDTKERILSAARILFAKKGFDGTSVREIAKDANVNVALINYHYQTKDKLFCEIIRSSYDQTANGIKNYYDENRPNLEELMMHIYRHLAANSTELISLFKLIISSHHPHEEVLTKQQQDDTYAFGPPSGATIAKAILKEVGRDIKDADLHWAVRTLFTHVCHTVIITCSFCSTSNKLDYMDEQNINYSISKLVKIVIQELKHKA